MCGVKDVSRRESLFRGGGRAVCEEVYADGSCKGWEVKSDSEDDVAFNNNEIISK